MITQEDLNKAFLIDFLIQTMSIDEAHRLILDDWDDWE